MDSKNEIKYDLLSKYDLLGKFISAKHGVYKGGILEYLKFSNRIGFMLASICAVSFFLSLVGVYYSFDVVYNLSEAQEFYNETVGKVNGEYKFKPSSNFFTDTYEVNNYYLLVPSLTICILSVIVIYSGFIAATNLDKSFICPHCKKRILLKNIQDYTCPICSETGLNSKNFMDGCPHCKEIMRFYRCPNPNCNMKIDLEAPYNEKELMRSRYE